MKTAIDSSILLDILAGNEFADSSERALLKSRCEGALIVCDMVVAEITPALDRNETENFLSDLGIGFSPSSVEESFLAGEWFKNYLKHGGKTGRIAADFIIAAHSVVNSARLLGRDRGFGRKVFEGKLKIVSP